MRSEIELFIKKTSPSQFAKYIDHTILSPNADLTKIHNACKEALKYGFKAIVVPPIWVNHARHVVHEAVSVCTVVGFPLGYVPTGVKVRETEIAIESGANEVDMVMNISAFKSANYDYVFNDISSVATICKENNVILKVIVEAGLLSEEELRKACMLSERAGANYVKTSTGFGPRGASIRDIIIMKSVVSPNIGVKAAGGIRHAIDAVIMIIAGADRIGTSRGVEIIEEYKRLRESIG